MRQATVGCYKLTIDKGVEPKRRRMVCPVHLGRAIAAVGSQHADETLNLWSSLPTSGEKVCPATDNFGGVVSPSSLRIANRMAAI